MYQTLYRKYRPKILEDIVGQDVIVKILKNQILNNKINHAYMLTGPRGTGKTSIAKILAKIYNCENLNGTTPCNICVSCTQILHNKEVDIVEIDAASNNGVEEIRELKSQINLSTNNSKFRIYIIDEVHMLSIGAFNALLKTLEEPPSHVIFILATTDIHKVPTTILSRCQRYDFKRVSINDIVKRLKYIANNENINISDDILYKIANVADGGVRDAIGILEQVSCFSNNKVEEKDFNTVVGLIDDKLIEEFILNLKTNKINDCLNLINIINDDGKDLIKTFEKIIFIYKNKILKNKSIIYEDITIIKKMIDILNKMKETNNPKMFLEIGIIDIALDNNYNYKNIENENINSNIIISVPELEFQNIENNIFSNKQKFINENESSKNENIKLTTTNNIERHFDGNINYILDNKLLEKLDELKTIRINNMLTNVSKKELIYIKNNIKKLQKLLINPEISEVVSLILDGNIKCYGNGYLCFSYNLSKNNIIFNCNLKVIENIINENLKNNVKLNVISVTDDEWEKIKKEYNTKTKKYEYITEKETIIEEIEYIINNSKLNNDNNNNNNEIENLFKGIIE